MVSNDVSRLPYRNNVSCILFREDKYLLVQLNEWPEHWWKFPQGGIRKGESEKEAIIVPLGGIQSLEDKEIVFVKIADDKFQARQIKIGQKSGQEAEVLEGLNAGDEVTVQGTFILKSELLKESLGGEE